MNVDKCDIVCLYLPHMVTCTSVVHSISCCKLEVINMTLWVYWTLKKLVDCTISNAVGARDGQMGYHFTCNHITKLIIHPLPIHTHSWVWPNFKTAPTRHPPVDFRSIGDAWNIGACFSSSAIHYNSKPYNHMANKLWSLDKKRIHYSSLIPKFAAQFMIVPNNLAQLINRQSFQTIFLTFFLRFGCYCVPNILSCYCLMTLLSHITYLTMSIHRVVFHLICSAPTHPKLIKIGLLFCLTSLSLQLKPPSAHL